MSPPAAMILQLSSSPMVCTTNQLSRLANGPSSLLPNGPPFSTDHASSGPKPTLCPLHHVHIPVWVGTKLATRNIRMSNLLTARLAHSASHRLVPSPQVFMSASSHLSWSWVTSSPTSSSRLASPAPEVLSTTPGIGPMLSNASYSQVVIASCT